MPNSRIPRFGLRLALSLALGAPLPARMAVPEYDAKALLVSHLIPFVTWPQRAAASEFNVCILGSTAFNGALAEALLGDTVEGRPIVVRRETIAGAVADCDVVVITTDARESLPRILSTLAGRPVLTVSDVPDFAANGGMVGLAINEQHRLRVQVNLDAVRASGLRLSSQLLRVAEIVKGAPQ